MIKISKIDDDLQIYKGKNVILFGASHAGIGVSRFLEEEHIPVYAFCDNDATKWGRTLEGIQIISPQKLSEIENKVVQITSVYEKEILEQLKGIDVSEVISYSEAKSRLYALKLKKIFHQYGVENEYLELFCYGDRLEKDLFSKIYIEQRMPEVYVCMPPKTGDYSLIESMKDKKTAMNFWHRPYAFSSSLFRKISKKEGNKIKLITAVRDPIAQNLSVLYQMLDSPHYFLEWEEYWKHGGDLNLLFRHWLEAEEYIKTAKGSAGLYSQMVKKQRFLCMIQKFTEEFASHVINLYEHPFDREQGYSIICEGNYEIFVYQLERLDKIQEKLFEWLGIPGTVLKNENIGEEKWYRDSYRKAKKELTIPREYFEKCYNEPYVKHFYSKEDIMKFREHWSTHVSDSLD